MKKVLLLLIGVVLFIALVFFKLNLTDFAQTVSERLSWTFYSFICIAVVSQLALRAVRFKLLFNNVFEYNIPLLKSFLLTSASFFVALATPVKLGDMVRGLFVKGRGLEITAICFIEYLLDVLVVLAVPAFGLVFLYRYYLFEVVAAYLFLALGLAVLFVLFKSARAKGIIKRTKLYRKSKDKIDMLKLYFKEGLKNKAILSMSFLCTCLFYGI